MLLCVQYNTRLKHNCNLIGTQHIVLHVLPHQVLIIKCEKYGHIVYSDMLLIRQKLFILIILYYTVGLINCIIFYLDSL